MSINITIPPNNSFFLQTENQFSATFNAITPGRYDWDGANPLSPNNSVQVLELDPWSIYILERINFTCNIDEGDFKDVQISGDALNLRLFLGETQNKVHLEPIPFINYLKNLETYMPFYSNEEGDTLRAQFDGNLGTNFNIAGKLVVTALVQFNIYRVQSSEWVKRFKDLKLDSGANLRKY